MSHGGSPHDHFFLFFLRKMKVGLWFYIVCTLFFKVFSCDLLYETQDAASVFLCDASKSKPQGCKTFWDNTYISFCVVEPQTIPSTNNTMTNNATAVNTSMTNLTIPNISKYIPVFPPVNLTTSVITTPTTTILPTTTKISTTTTILPTTTKIWTTAPQMTTVPFNTLVNRSMNKTHFATRSTPIDDDIRESTTNSGFIIAIVLVVITLCIIVAVVIHKKTSLCRRRKRDKVTIEMQEDIENPPLRSLKKRSLTLPELQPRVKIRTPSVYPEHFNNHPKLRRKSSKQIIPVNNTGPYPVTLSPPNKKVLVDCEELLKSLGNHDDEEEEVKEDMPQKDTRTVENNKEDNNIEENLPLPTHSPPRSPPLPSRRPPFISETLPPIPPRPNIGKQPIFHDHSWQTPRIQSKPNLPKKLKAVGQVAKMISHFETNATDIPTYQTDLFSTDSTIHEKSTTR
jgi:hypothetical protein